MNLSKLIAAGIVALAVMIVGLTLWFVVLKPDQQAGPNGPPSIEGQYSDYPMNWELTSFVEIAEGQQLHLTHKVTYDRETGNYVYYYRAELRGDGSVLLQWSVLDRMVGDGPNLLMVEGVREFSIQTKIPPMMENQPMRWFVSQDGANWKFGGEVMTRGPVAPGLLIAPEKEAGKLETTELGPATPKEN